MSRERVWRIAMMLLVSVCVAGAAPATGTQLRTGAFEPPRAAPDFALRGSDGAAFRLSQHRGRVLALAFGYTHCPDVCPTILAELARVREDLGAAAPRFQVVYVSVDPERDTVARLRAFVGAFDSTFVGLTGAAADLAPVWKAYGVTVTRAPGGTPDRYAVHHTAVVHLVDASGRLRAAAPFGTPAEDLAHDVALLLAEPAAKSAIRLDGAWVRRAALTGDRSATAAGYVTIHNGAAAADALVAARTEVADAVEIHETRLHQGMAMMEQVRKVAIASSARVELKPGGYHLMLMGLRRALEPGQAIEMTLVFERAGPVTVRATVR